MSVVLPDEKHGFDPLPARPAPWHPVALVFLSLLLTNYGSGTLLAWNWRRFGKSEWAWWTLAGMGALLFAMLGVLALYGKIAPTLPPAQRPLAAVLAFLPVCLNIFYPVFIGSLQLGAYKKRHDAGLMHAHRYGFGRALLYTGTLVAVAVTIVGAYLVRELAPRTFRDDALALMYPPTWVALPAAEQEICKALAGGGHCRVVLQETGATPSLLVIIEESLPTAVAFKDFEPLFWRQIKASANATLDTYAELVIDGFPAVQRFYYFEQEAGSGYEMYIAILDGQRLFLMFATASTRAILRDDLNDLQSIYTSVDFSNPPDL